MDGWKVRSQKARDQEQKPKFPASAPLPYAFRHLPADFRFFLLLTAFCLLLPSCMVGPTYKRPPVPAPPAFKELPAANSPQASEWAPAQPNDAIARGKWWEIYDDPKLNALEEQVSISNQNIKMAEAQFREAKFAVRIARSNLYPTVSVTPTIVNARSSSNGASSSGQITTTYDLPVGVSWEADTWGSIRRSILSSAEAAQVSDAQMENARLSYQAELAQDYFELRGTDGEKELLETTVKSYEDYIKLTQERFDAGVASGSDVAQAQTQLETARTQLIDYDVARAQYEHAIAVLAGKAPAELSIPRGSIKITPPPVPVGLPSQLLERRPDIATAERQMAEANEQIGIAKAAFYPAIGLTTNSAPIGLESTSFLHWISWPSRFWSVGPGLEETVFDAGKRRAALNQSLAAYDATVANYRQTVLTAFQQVEDNLAALRVLENEAKAEAVAVQAAQSSLDLSTYQYKAGVANYLTVITEQALLLQNQVQAVNILTRRMSSSVLLIEALGGGWDTSKLPKVADLKSGK
jgi:NodT family efflux transporter outer membrane factor (OMF) lipoprotein